MASDVVAPADAELGEFLVRRGVLGEEGVGVRRVPTHVLRHLRRREQRQVRGQLQQALLPPRGQQREVGVVELEGLRRPRGVEPAPLRVRAPRDARSGTGSMLV